MGPAASANQHLGSSRRAFQICHALGGTHAGAFSPPSSLALVLGSRRSETGLLEIGSGEIVRARRGHDTCATAERNASRPTGR